MKEKLLALLVAKFAGVPEATLERIASKKAGSVSDESQLQSIADGIDFAQVLQSEVDSRITDANKKAVQNYETQHGLKDGKPVQANPNPSTTPPANPNDLAAIVAQAIAPLAQKLEAFEKAKSAETYISSARAKLKEKGIPESFVGSIAVESEEQIEQFVSAQEARFIAFKQEQINSGNWVDKPNASSQNAAERSVDDYVKIMDGGTATKVGTVDLGVS